MTDPTAARGPARLWRHLRLGQKVGLAILAACVPVVSLGIQVAAISSNLLKEAVLSNAGLAARVEADGVATALAAATDAVESIADDQTFQELIEQQSRLDGASGTTSQLQTYTELVWGRFRTDGLVGLSVVSNGGGGIQAQGDLSPEAEALRIEVGQRTLVVGEAFTAPSGAQHLAIVRSVAPPNGGVGVQIVTEWDITTLLAGVVDPSNVRLAERTLVLQQQNNGSYVAVLRSDSTQTGQTIALASSPVAGADDPAVEAVDELGIDVVQGAARVGSDPGWVVVVEEHQSVAYAELDRVRSAVIIVFVAAGLMILAVVAVAFRSFARRLGRMTSLAEAVASGDLTVRTGDPRHDELGRLSHAFDDMTEALAEDIARRERVEAQLAYQATHDALTGLPNRQQLIGELDEVLETEDVVAVLFVDLDGFKAVNDNHGHGAGDELLVRVAERLRDVLRPNDFLARLGGDEFVIVLRQMGILEAERLAERVVGALELPFIVSNVEVSISASIGVSSGDSEQSGERLIKEADIAMYRAKAMGKGRAVRVTDESLDAVEEKSSVLAELRQAVARNHLELQWWPVADLSTGSLTGMEATVRWRHPERGVIPPAEFLPLARTSGFATQIDQWVVTRAAELADEWLAAGLGVTDLELAINLTPDVFTDSRSQALCRTAFSGGRLRASNFRIEVPEAILAEDSEILRRSFDAFREIGTPVTLDRFGADRHSVDRLPRYAIDAVKIDLALTSDLTNRLSSRTLVASLISLADNAGLRITAAGVDTAVQRDELLELGCTRGQGRWVSPVLSSDDMAHLIEARHLVEPI